MSRSETSPHKPSSFWLVGLILVMTVLIPFVAAPADTKFHGMAALMWEGLSILGFALLLFNSRWRIDRKSIGSFLTTGANLPILLFLAFCAYSWINSPLKGYSSQELMRIIAGALIYFVVAYQFRRSSQMNLLVNTLMVVASGVAVIGFLEYVGSDKEQAGGLFGDHQLMGSFLMLMLPVAVTMAITEKSRSGQLLAQISAVLVAAGLLLTQDRSAWVGGGCALIALAAMSLYFLVREKPKFRAQDTVVSIGLFVGAMALFLMLWPQTSALIDRLSTLQHVPSVGNWHDRVGIWHGAMKMVRERLFGGFGLGLYPYYQWSYTHSGMALPLSGGRASLSEQAHNVYLQTAVELGLPGLLLLLAVPITFIAVGIRRMLQMHPGSRRNLLMGVMASLVAVAIDGFASPSWQFGQVSMFLWMLMGLGLCCTVPSPGREKVGEEARGRSASDMVKRPAIATACLALASLLPTSVYAADGALYHHSPLVPILLSSAATGVPFLIGKKNTVQIIVANHPELSETDDVEPDDTINYKPLGRLLLTNLSVEDLAEKVHQMLIDIDKIDETDSVVAVTASRNANGS